MVSYPEIICIALGVIIACLSIIIIGIKIIGILKQRFTFDMEKYKDERRDILLSPARTREFHEFIKFLTIETATIKFKKFRMRNDISKVSRNSIQQLIIEIASETFDSLNKEIQIFDNYNLLTKECYMKYISDVAMITIDKLIDDIVDGVIE